ncbi:MAG: phenylalanine--tRNA ligase subunit beta [Acidobacteria bacterium]|nr:phenylalanine--tRNA ligase subunit beta [Acidobacteriota bacterium]
MVGLAVEGRRARGEDVILDVDVTTNRPDCMNHLGLAREVAVRFRRELRLPEIEIAESDESASDAIAVELADSAGCPRYVARVVRGVEVGPSPDWLRERLEAIGQRPINNIVDVTNFVMWETGQPVHGFDLAKIRGGKIIVRRAAVGETLITLDGEERELDPRVLVIADTQRAVALGGVMGGLDSEVTEATSDVLIECAHFDPAVVRQGAAQLAIHTDANHRFERGADPESPAFAAGRVAQLITEVAGGTVLAGAVDVRSESMPQPLFGHLDHQRVQAFGGVEIAPAEVERILRGLGFALEAEGESGWRVEVPSWRYHDMKTTRADGTVYEADLFEEVLRHVGYANIPSALPPVRAPDEGSSAAHDRRQRRRQHLVACGLVEAINYAFHAESEDGRFGLWCEGSPIRLANPLSELYSVLRRSLMNGLVASAEFNQNRGAEAVQLFEAGHVFPGTGQAEVETVALILGGVRGTPWQRRSPLDLFDLKGCVDSLAAASGIGLEYLPAAVLGVLPGTGATLHVKDEDRAIGWLGHLALEDSIYSLYGAELEVEALVPGDRFSTVRAPSRHPGVAVDLTLTHSRGVTWSEMANLIAESMPADLVDFGLKDRYEGAGVPAGAVNTTIYFIYNAESRSLTQDEVNQRQQPLTDSLERRFGWQEG